MDMQEIKSIDGQAISFARTNRRPASMSDYFPAGTCYFYGYPAGESAGFLNKVPPTVEELVAARICNCAGSNLSVVDFMATNPPYIDAELLDKLGIPYAHSGHDVVLPEDIDEKLTGSDRNAAVKAALINSINPGSLVMAQPFVDDSMADLYQIAPELTTWLNDKSNLPQIIGSDFIPARLGEYQSGQDFYENGTSELLPCVVKAALSSSGDGVYICHSDEDFVETREQLKNFEGKIIIEQFIEVKNNYCINFGIPYDREQPIEIIGFNEQLIDKQGNFLGGTIKTTDFPAELDGILLYMLKTALPKVRQRGWYGIGGLDVLTDNNGNAYFIDGNFRINGTSTYHFLVKNNLIKPPLITFGGQFVGSREQFEQAMLPFASAEADQSIVRLIALSKHDDSWNMNGALMYSNAAELKQRVQALINAGVKSSALEQLASD